MFKTKDLIMKVAISSFTAAPSTPFSSLGSNPPAIEKRFPTPQAQQPFWCSLGKKLLKRVGREETPLIKAINALAKRTDIIKESSQKVSLFLEAVDSKHLFRLEKKLRIIIKNMSDLERKLLLEKALKTDFEKGQRFRGNQCIQWMSLKHLRSLISLTSCEGKEIPLIDQKALDTHLIAKRVDTVRQIIKKYEGEEARMKLLHTSKQFFLFRIFNNLVRTLIVAFNLLELGKEPNTYFETKYMLDIYWRLLEIPLHIIKFVLHLIVNPFISVAVIAGGTVASGIASLFFKRWLNRCPNQLPYCINLTQQIKNGFIKPIYGREQELDEIIQALACNNETGRKHPLLIGKSGIGKTELMKGLGWRLATGEVPPVLKNKKLFYVNSGELARNGNLFDFKSPLKQLIDKIGEHRKDIILVFEEAHNLSDISGQRFNSVIDTSPDSLFYVVGITTPEEYEAKIETTTLDRRFKKIPIQEASLEQTRTILRHMNRQEAKDIRISKKVLNHIYEQTSSKIVKRHQPDKSIFVLSEGIKTVRSLQEGGSFKDKLNQLMAKKEDLASKLSQKKLHGLSLQSPHLRKISLDLQTIERKIETCLKKIELKQKAFQTFLDLKKQQEWHEKWFYNTSEVLVDQATKGEKTPKILEKLYLFNAYFLLPQLDRHLSNFVAKHQIEGEVTKEIITTIVDRLAKQEKIEPAKVS
ncbi:hypothetical protein NEOC84_000711|nr:hypothetical protein [Neochlamydia sp. AcF84]